MLGLPYCLAAKITGADSLRPSIRRLVDPISGVVGVCPNEVLSNSLHTSVYQLNSISDRTLFLFQAYASIGQCATDLVNWDC